MSLLTIYYYNTVRTIYYGTHSPKKKAVFTLLQFSDGHSSNLRACLYYLPRWLDIIV